MEIDVNTLNRIIEFQVATYSRAILARVSVMFGERPAPVGRQGIIQSYDPTDGTVEVIFGDGAAIITGRQGDGDTPPTERRIPLITNHHGDQAGPIGGERCVVIPTQSGYAAHIIYDEDDSPGAPAGERWITHLDPATGEVNAYIKLTNDGKTSGDGLGGNRVLVGAYGTIETTGGHTIALDDTGKQITLTTAGGLTLILDDNTDTIQLAGSGNAAGGAIVRDSDMQAAFNAFAATVQTWGGENFSHGSSSPPEPTPPTVTGSPKSFTA